MRVIIAEKPSVARDIARVLNITSRQDGYIQGHDTCVTWAFGHLVGLATPEAYGSYKTWRIADLPIFPNEFIYILSENPTAKKQFNIIKQLFSKADEIICATDAGREGEAIFRYIYYQCGCTVPFKRLWISSLTDSAILSGFKALKSGSEYNSLFRSAKARNEADWLVGMNTTRALTLAAKSRQPLSLGRVQTPTLGIICERYLENKNFVPTPYFVISTKLYAQQPFVANYPIKFKNREEAARILDFIKDSVTVANKERKEKTEKPPLLFDLTALQSEANRRHKFKAQKTLDLTQKMYEEHKILTYPRTSSRYLGTDMIPEIERNITSLSGIFDTKVDNAIKFLGSKIEKFCFDDSKLSDHHAIIPTFQHLDKLNSLSEDERKIFDLVALQLVKALLPVCKKEILSYKFIFSKECDFLQTSGTRILSAGWRAVDIPIKEENEEEENNQLLPELKEGEKIDVLEKIILDKETTRPALLTEASLLDIMKTAGRLIDDEELKEAIKECGIGTPATRAAIIETLFARKYIISEKNKLCPTELGLSIYEIVKKQTIGNAAMTGEWEKKLNAIAANNYDTEVFYKEIKEFVAEEVKRLLEVGKSTSAAQIEEKEILKCPLCGQRIFESQKAFGCSGYKEGCKFTIWKEICGKAITKKQAELLITKGKSDFLKGFKSKQGKSFDAFLVMDKTGKISFEFKK